jgi:hypothetical protein
MKTLFETALGMGARKGFAPIPVLRGAILVKRYLISVALRAAWRRIKFSNVGDLARQNPAKAFSAVALQVNARLPHCIA